MPYCPWHPLQVLTVYYRVPTLTPESVCTAQSLTSFPDVHSVLHSSQSRVQVSAGLCMVPSLVPRCPLCPVQSLTSFPDIHFVLHGPQPSIQMSTVSCTILDDVPGCPVDSSQGMDSKAQARRIAVGSQMGPSCQVSSSLCYNNSPLQDVSFTEQGCWPCVIQVNVRVSGSNPNQQSSAAGNGAFSTWFNILIN